VQVPIINAGDGTHEHPTQALLDAFSLQEKFGYLKGLKVAIIGDILHSRVARSNIYLLKKMGAEITVCGPPTLIPNHIHQLGVKVSYNLLETLLWCDAANFLRIQLERQNIKFIPSLREYAYLYGLDLPKFKTLNKNIVILHPGPINRGVELSSEIADSPHAIILNQVENGVAMRMAVLFLLGQKCKPQ
jgi:aspartate carbamoyltransferase catalytic subunit